MSDLPSLLLAALAAVAAHTAPPPVSGTSPACDRACRDATLRLNDMTVVGTHNSYKQAIPRAELAALSARDAGAVALDYAFPSLTRQLEAGARQLEIDVLNDPDGGRYARPMTALGQGTTLSPTFHAAMAQPGFKTLHMPDVDFRSSCLRFVQCLQEIDTWSRAHPQHVPLLILLNAKTGAPSLPGGVRPLDFNAAAWDALDAEIRSVFGVDRLISPDSVRGSHATLREAVLAGGWPRLQQARGKVLFALDEDAAKVAQYSAGRPSLQGRAMFVNSDEHSPAAAYLTLNDPIAQAARIRAAVAQGFIVRTRADAETEEARRNDTRRRAAAFASGAQYISTDYLWPDLRFSGYTVRLPAGQVAVCNPQRGAQRCHGAALEP
ncbi:MAG: hypothetical protein GAK31_00331 [Stenotrophomonas maltophilia]|uniref:Calcium-dependent phosphoinositide phospholipase C n=1 Tax=Stenotrophomonas maltophilia TaxID=40324 RepID=A0A7V8FJB3_STEMA|nr:MAG: hypothetical protein GAK31_00331 [Stenotrophomonas maltophilia]